MYRFFIYLLAIADITIGFIILYGRSRRFKYYNYRAFLASIDPFGGKFKRDRHPAKK